MKTSTLRIACVLPLIALSSGVAIAGESIGIHFLGGYKGKPGGTVPATATAGAPAVAQKNWNNISGSSGSAIDLKSHEGKPSGATLTFSAPGTWVSGLDSAKGADYALMDGYLDFIKPGEHTTVTVSNIPYAKYDVYVYVNGSNPEGNRVAELTVGDESKSLLDNHAFDGKFVKSDGAGGGGNYVEFAGLTGKTFTLTAKAGEAKDHTPRAPLNAVQIVSAP